MVIFSRPFGLGVCAVFRPCFFDEAASSSFWRDVRRASSHGLQIVQPEILKIFGLFALPMAQ
jgi:hypothetical protein